MTNTSIHHGLLLLEAGNIASAQRIAEDALSKNPDNEDAFSLMNQCLRKDGDYEKAYQSAKAWLANHPDSEEGYTALIWTCLLNKKWKNECLKAIQTYKQILPNQIDEAKMYECAYEIHWGSTDKAIRMINNLRANHPELIGLMTIHAFASYEVDQYERACKLCKEALRLDPNNANMWRWLAISSYRDMRFTQARKAAKECLRLDPNARTMRQIIWLSWLVYFPVFLVAEFMNWFITKIIALIGGGTTYRVVISIILYYLIAKFILAPLLLEIDIFALENALGFPYLLTGFFVLFIGWLWGSEALIIQQDNQIDKKPKPVELSDY